MFVKLNLSRYATLLTFIAGLAAAAAVTADPVDHHFSGFATLGLVVNDNPDLRFRRDVSQADGSYDNDVAWKTDSLVGVQWQSRWSDQFDTTIQLVAKERFNNNFDKAIEWAFLRYRPMDGLDFRVGRLGSDLFMLSEYRQVGYAFPWVRPPQEFYGFLSFYHFDGMDINKRFDLQHGTLNVKLFYGNSDEDYPTADADTPGVNMDFDVAGISFKLEWDDWKFRYSYSHVDINNNIVTPLTDALAGVAPLWPEANIFAHDLSTRDKYIIYNEFGVGYDNNDWWAQAEATDLRSDSSLMPNSRHFYLSIGQRFGPVSVYGIGGYVRPKHDVPAIIPPAGYPSPIAEQLAILAYVTSASLEGVRLEQKSYGVGARWDFASKMAVKLQVEKFDIESDGSGLWVRNQPIGTDIDQTSTVISLAMDVLF